MESLWSRAERQAGDWRSISLRLPAPSDQTLTFTLDRGDGGQPQKRAQLTPDRRSGEVAGLFGQTIAALASAAAALLVWTGLALAWRRFRAWSARRRVRSDDTATQLGPVTMALCDSSVGQPK